MKYPTNPNEYHTIYLKWPETIPRKCPLCGSSIEMKYKDNGRIVRTLRGNINQITWKYVCTNPDCYLHSNPFNPHPRFEFDGYYFGRDVVQKVAYYGLKERFKPAHIASLFNGEYNLEISESTIRRMLMMITVVKSAAIDERTLEIIKKQGFILLGLDGEDPQCDGPALWCFLDLISNRVLHTVYLDSAPAERLRDEINIIIERYGVEIRGVVSDKQNNIVSCMRRYFPQIPHQFCTFHFAQNLWNHIELKDGVLFKKLSKMLRQSYFMNLDPNTEVFFEEHGKLKPREIFEPIIQDIKRMRRIRTKKFESLRGLQLFEEIDDYCAEMYAAALRIPEGYRMRLIFMREFEKWSNTIMEVYELYDEVYELYDLFGEIYHNLFTEQIEITEKKKILSEIFDLIEEKLKATVKDYDRKNLRSFLPKSNSTMTEILGEWVRLWHSYLPGLFIYGNFPKPINSIVSLERGFGLQKSRFYGRIAKKRIGTLIRNEGDYHLRFVFCEPEELVSDIFEEAIRYNWRDLISRHGSRLSEIRSSWLRNQERLKKIMGVSTLYYGERLT